MRFKYSICDPLEKEIIYTEQKINANQVLALVEEYPWVEKLNVSEQHGTLPHFSPSLNFKNEDNAQEFCLTAHFNQNNILEFSIWYSRPIKTKVCFGLFGEKEKIVVSDAWDFLLEDALVYLKYFVKGQYEELERFYLNLYK